MSRFTIVLSLSFFCFFSTLGASLTEEVAEAFLSEIKRPPPLLSKWTEINRKIEFGIEYKYNSVEYYFNDKKAQTRYLEGINTKELLEIILGNMCVLHVGRTAPGTTFTLTLDQLGSRIEIREYKGETSFSMSYRGNSSISPASHFKNHIQSTSFKRSYASFASRITYKWYLSQRDTDVSEAEREIREKEYRRENWAVVMQGFSEGLASAADDISKDDPKAVRGLKKDFKSASKQINNASKKLDDYMKQRNDSRSNALADSSYSMSSQEWTQYILSESSSGITLNDNGLTNYYNVYDFSKENHSDRPFFSVHILKEILLIYNDEDPRNPDFVNYGNRGVNMIKYEPWNHKNISSCEDCIR